MRAGCFLLLYFLTACSGPREVRVGVDGAHENWHTLDGNLWNFHGVYKQAAPEGVEYRFRETTAPFDLADLELLDVWVVAGSRSAIRADEIDAMVDWVEDGGSLWLMVDHPPFVAPAAELAEAFGFELVDQGAGSRVTLVLEGGLLQDHPVIDGAGGRVHRLFAAAGTGFFVPPQGAVAAWAPNRYQEVAPGERRAAMMATVEYGEGRVLLTGETSMFTCQTRTDGSHFGFCEPGHEDGRVAVRNAARWLARSE